MRNLRFLRKRDTGDMIGGASNSQLDNLEKDGLITPRINISKRAVGWPEHEINALNAARIAGKTDDDIRALVKRLVAARKTAFEQFEGEAA